jgi:hypothetical protein
MVISKLVNNVAKLFEFPISLDNYELRYPKFHICNMCF